MTEGGDGAEGAGEARSGGTRREVDELNVIQ